MTSFDVIRTAMQRDLMQILAACPDLTSVHAIAYYKGELWTSLVLADTDAFGIEFRDGHPQPPDVSVVSIIESPETHPHLWRKLPDDEITATPCSSPFVPKSYFVLRKNDQGCGLAISSLSNEGRFGWSGNAEMINTFGKMISQCGVGLRREKRTPAV